MSFYERLLNDAFRYLSYRPRSEQEVFIYLTRRVKRYISLTPTQQKNEIERVCARLKELEYINDTKFVTWWVQSRNSSNPKGKQFLRFELQQKGIAKHLIEDVLSTISSDDFRGHALHILQKKDTTLKKLSVLEYRYKAQQMLYRRGFSADIIREVIDEEVKKHYNEANK